MIKRSSLFALALTVAMPLAAFAQAAPPAAPSAPAPGPRWTPSPEMQARMQRAHDDLRAAALASLSPAHRSAVQAIVDQVNSGKVTDAKDAVNRIDSVLTYNEAKAILAQGKKAMAAMHGGFGRGGPYGGPGAPSGGPGGPPGGPGGPPPPAAMPAPGALAPSGAPVAMGPPGPPGGWGQRGRHHHLSMMHRAPDAGMLLLMVSVNHERMQSLMQSMHAAHGMHAGQGRPPQQ